MFPQAVILPSATLTTPPPPPVSDGRRRRREGRDARRVGNRARRTSVVPNASLWSFSASSAGSQQVKPLPSGVRSDDAVPAAHLPTDLVASSDTLRTVAGEPVRSFALGGNRNVRQPRELAPTARASGVNYFFAYSMARSPPSPVSGALLLSVKLHL